ncbi:20474_t:CDS:10 [Entrophospora sp. SA101]|nr:20474_t:CDS:10 [Entrophospora sp. SA101]
MAPSSKFDKLPSGFEISPDNSYAVFSKIIEKPENDDRSYRLIHLNNELEALLIHDPETDKSSAALDVHVGQLSDPDNLEGLAHFCEHLLFMGTKKYPKENEYSEYLSNHGGYSNAYTSEDHTNYYFEVAHENLEEFKKNLQSDTIRLYELGRILSSPKHPYKKFGTGNLVTLKDNPLKEGLDIRDELLKFHNNYYSANIMKLVVLGQEPLDQLTQWVVDKFSDINNKSIPAPIFKETPYTKNELMKKVFVKPVKDLIILKIRFPFPVQDPLFRAKPGRYLSHLLGHEGAGSIFSLLKKKGLANSLDAGPGDAGAGFGFFYIDVDLTESGLANYEEIVKIIFQYIKMLKNEGIQEWIYHEAEILSAVSFKFKEKSQPEDYTSELSNALQSSYPREWVLNKSYIFREYNPKLIQESLDWLRPDNFILTLVSQTFTNLDQKEKWYGTEYKVEPMSENFLQELKSTTIDSELKLPLPNEFIPTNFEIKKQGIITKELPLFFDYMIEFIEPVFESFYRIQIRIFRHSIKRLEKVVDKSDIDIDSSIVDSYDERVEDAKNQIQSLTLLNREAKLAKSNPENAYSATPSVSARKASFNSMNSSSNSKLFPVNKKIPSPIPPPIPAKPKIAYVKALYDYDAQADGDLSFHKGDKIEVLKRTPNTDDWWEGKLNGVTGIFPGNYVEEL